MLYSLLAVVGSKEHTPTHSHGCCAQTNSLEDISSTPNTAVHINLHMIKDLRATPVDL